MSLFSLYGYVLFAFVLGALALLSRCAPSKRFFQHAVLLAASLAFIACASVQGVLVMLAASAVTWFCGRRRSKYAQYAGIAVLLALLCFYKYVDARNVHVIVPLGVSFFTFNAISYLADVAKGEIAPAGFVRVALYLSFFPRLASGPLQKAGDFFAQLDGERTITRKNLSAGVQMYCFGLFKKLVLADRLSVFVNEVYATPAAFSWVSILLALVSYSLQIYFDFSGYSDMAIGTGTMLGFNLPRNFNMPYRSQNVTEFWRRWHISLSSWIRAYIYIPLGGNRKGTVRQGVNLLVAMTLCGLWHGAAWTFVLWGLVHGIMLLLHKQFARKCRRSDSTGASAPGKTISTVLTFAFVTLAWVLFRAESLQQAFFIYQRLFTFADGLHQPYLWSFVSLAVLALALFVTTRSKGEAFYPILTLSKYTHLTVFFIFLGLLFGLCYTGGSPFIYGAF